MFTFSLETKRLNVKKYKGFLFITTVENRWTRLVFIIQARIFIFDLSLDVGLTQIDSCLFCTIQNFWICTVVKEQKCNFLLFVFQSKMKWCVSFTVLSIDICSMFDKNFGDCSSTKSRSSMQWSIVSVINSINISSFFNEKLKDRLESL